MNMKELLKINFTGKTVVIIGVPGSGKTQLALKLKKTNKKHTVIHSDTYIEFGFKDSLYRMMEFIEHTKKLNKPMIIEGVGCYRLLRKGVELDCFYPDIVINLMITEKQLNQVYSKREQMDKLDGVHRMIKANDTVIKKWMSMDKSKHLPQIINIHNNFEV